MELPAAFHDLQKQGASLDGLAAFFQSDFQPDGKDRAGAEIAARYRRGVESSAAGGLYRV